MRQLENKLIMQTKKRQVIRKKRAYQISSNIFVLAVVKTVEYPAIFVQFYMTKNKDTLSGAKQLTRKEKSAENKQSKKVYIITQQQFFKTTITTIKIPVQPFFMRPKYKKKIHS